jgi:hypothetical protein
MGLVTCNQERAFDITLLIGEGLLFNLYTSWMDAFPSSSIQLKYFEASTSAAITDLSNCTLLLARSTSFFICV